MLALAAKEETRTQKALRTATDKLQDTATKKLETDGQKAIEQSDIGQKIKVCPCECKMAAQYNEWTGLVRGRKGKTERRLLLLGVIEHEPGRGLGDAVHAAYSMWNGFYGYEYLLFFGLTIYLRDYE